VATPRHTRSLMTSPVPELPTDDRGTSRRHDEEPLIDINGVRKAFKTRAGTIPALVDTTLTVDAGTLVCLLGPSGCGKSTLLNMLAGFLAPDAGEIRIDGKIVTGPGADRGMVFQQPALFPWLNVLENVMFGPRARHVNSPEVRDRARELLTLVGLERFASHLPHELSGGMKQRLAIARALINEPRVLLMDEPFGALDALTRANMQDFLLSLWEQRRITIVFVTHDVEEAVLLGNRIAVMSASPGRVDDVQDVDLPRPRRYAEVDTEPYVRIRRAVRARLGKVGDEHS
jgi:NitT/TauT family transport system ATP-binding protein